MIFVERINFKDTTLNDKHNDGLEKQSPDLDLTKEESVLAPFPTAPEIRENNAFKIACLFLFLFATFLTIGAFRLTSNQELNDFCKNLGQLFSPFLGFIAGHYFRGK
jgi:hypothetical protein